MSKFKVGDVIKPNVYSDGFYRITNTSHMKKGVVRKILGDDLVEIYVTEWIKKDVDFPDSFVVQKECFDLVDVESEKSSVHITWDGESKTVRAVYKVGNEVVDRREANCHPDDNFDFFTGAKLALERVEVNSDIEEHTESDEIKIGDIVTVVDDGEGYSTNTKWFTDNGYEEFLPRYAYGVRHFKTTLGFEDSDTFKVIGKGSDIFGEDVLMLTPVFSNPEAISDRHEDSVFLINEQGVKKVS